MIEIVTLFMGLVSGPQQVELAVAPPVAAVELELDGEMVGWLDAPPWRLEVDLGAVLAPHELVAIARDAGGRELARARRWINIEFPLVEIGGAAPADGVTPLPVVQAPGATAADDMGDRFAVAGVPLTVHAVHAGPAEVVVVQHPAARPLLEEMAWAFLIRQLERLGVPAQPPPPGSPARDPELLRMPRNEFQGRLPEVFELPRGVPESQRAVGLWRAYRRFAGLGEGTTVRFISPLAAPVSRTTRPRQLFAASSGVADVGLFWLAENVPPMGFACRLADAVAIAGREAHAGGRRRAVVLLLSGEPCDESLFAAAAVRDYLRALRVPLFTWTLSAADTEPAWGEARFVGPERSGGRGARASGLGDAIVRLEAAAAELRRELDAQRIVLLAGGHLPHRITIAGAADGARPAGLAPAAAGGGEPR